MFGWFKKEKWTLVAEMERSFIGDGLWNKGEEVEMTFAFFENSSGERKVEAIGGDSSDRRQTMELTEPLIYKWRDHNGQLPVGAKKV